MKVVRVALKDFKVVEKAEILVTPLTILIGRNNSGKSTFLQALGLLSQSAGQGRLTTRMPPTLDLGATPGVLIRRPSTADHWEIEVDWRVVLPADDAIAPGSPVDVAFTIDVVAEDSWVSVGQVTVDAPPPRRVTAVVVNSPRGLQPARIVGAEYSDSRGAQYPPVDSPFAEGRSVPGTPGPWRFAVAEPGIERTQFTPQGMRTPEVASGYVSAMAAPILRDEIARALAAFRYVGPLRGFSESAYSLQEQPPPNVTRADEAATTLAYDRELMRTVDSRIREVLQTGLTYSLVPQRNVDLAAVSDAGEAFSLSNVGTGLGQVAWMIVQLELHL